MRNQGNGARWAALVAFLTAGALTAGAESPRPTPTDPRAPMNPVNFEVPSASTAFQLESLKTICAELREQNRLLRDLLGEMTALREVAERTHACQQGTARKAGGEQLPDASSSLYFLGIRPRFDGGAEVEEPFEDRMRGLRTGISIVF